MLYLIELQPQCLALRGAEKPYNPNDLIVQSKGSRHQRKGLILVVCGHVDQHLLGRR